MILESFKKEWTNPYGYVQNYSSKEMRMSKTGHLWYGSAMETDDSCGNCDGANCDSCRDLFTVLELSEPTPHYDPEWGYDYDETFTLSRRWFFNREEAKQYYDNL